MSPSAPATFNAGLSVGDRFWQKRLGVLLAAILQNTYRGTERDLNKEVMANGEEAEFISAIKSDTGQRSFLNNFVPLLHNSSHL